ncbi:MAG: HEAT repeat domain-containing protein [Actinomycetota bacterium]
MHQVRTDVGEVRVGTEECFRNLLAALDDEDAKVRRLAVCGLAACGDARAIDSLVERLHDPDEDIRTRVAVALGKIGDRRAAPALVHAASGDDLPLRRVAIMALGELDAGLDVLSDALRDPDPAVRVRAAIAFGETHDVVAVEPLTRALDDENPGVRHHARDALEKIRESRVF